MAIVPSSSSKTTITVELLPTKSAFSGSRREHRALGFAAEATGPHRATRVRCGNPSSLRLELSCAGSTAVGSANALSPTVHHTQPPGAAGRRSGRLGIRADGRGSPRNRPHFRWEPIRGDLSDIGQARGDANVATSRNRHPQVWEPWAVPCPTWSGQESFPFSAEPARPDGRSVFSAGSNGRRFQFLARRPSSRPSGSRSPSLRATLRPGVS